MNLDHAFDWIIRVITIKFFLTSLKGFLILDMLKNLNREATRELAIFIGKKINPRMESGTREGRGLV